MLNNQFNCSKAIASYFATTSKIPEIKFSFSSAPKHNSCVELRKIQEARNVSNFHLYNFFQEIKDEKSAFWLKNCEFIFFSKPNCKLADFKDLIKMVDSYLPPVRIAPIETIPLFDAIGCGMLSGSLKGYTVENKSFAQQEGEIKHFRDQVQKLQWEPFANGLFLHNISKSKILKI